MWTEAEIATFMKRLTHVISWTEGLAEYFDFEKGNYGKVFRKTNPRVNGTPLYRFEGKYASWDHYDHDPGIYEYLMKIITTAREAHSDVELKNLDQLGRILTFETSNTTYDGATIAESHGFVDEGDIPPLDTWFYLKNNYSHQGHTCEQAIFCWIPKRFEAMMQAAINVEIYDSYQWLDENDRFLYERIKNSPK